MTKEQEEAIKKLEYYLQNSVYKKVDSDSFENNWELVNLEIPQAIETVLNMLKEKDKKIEKLQKENKYIHKELDKQQTTINNYAKENEEKNKQIDLMAEYIDGDDTSLANYLYRKNGKCNKKMIKQYFERKVEE